MKKFFKIFAYCLLGLLLFLFALILLIRTPWAQQKITNYATQYLSGKTGTEVAIKKLFITFGGNVQLEGLFVADLQQDTLVYLGSLNTGLSLKSLYKGSLVISHVELKDLTANVHNENADSTFNYQFIIDAFAKEDQTEAETSKEETSSAPDLTIGKIALTNLQLRYVDIIEGMETSGQIGYLLVNPELIDLEKLAFHIRTIRIEKTDLAYTQHFKLEKEDSPNDSSESPMPSFKLNKLSISQTKLLYHDLSDSLFTDNYIDLLELEKASLDLGTQQISLQSLILNNSHFQLQLAAAETSPKTDQETKEVSPFVWPDWEIEIGKISFAGNSFSFDQGDEEPKTGLFDANHIGISKLNFGFENIVYKAQEASLNLRNFHLEERSGLSVQQLAMELQLDDQSLNIQKFNFQSPHNRWTADVNLLYASMDALIADFVKNVRMEVALDMPLLSWRDAVYFNDTLALDSTLLAIEQLKPSLSTRFEGNMEALDLQALTLHFGKDSELTLNGTFQELLDTAKLHFQIPQLLLTAHWNDLAAFGVDSLPTHLPQQYQITASAKGNLQDIKSQLRVQLSDSARLEIAAEYQELKGLAHYDLKLNAFQLPLSQWAGDSSLSSSTDFALNLSGSGTNLDELKAQLTLEFSQLSYNDYNLDPLQFTASVDQKVLISKISFEDEHLDLTTDIKAVLDSPNFQVELALTVVKANLMAIGYSADPLDMRLKLKANASGTAEEIVFHLDIVNGMIVDEGLAYPIDDFTIDAFLGADSTAINWESEAINARLQANANTASSIAAIQNHLKAHYGKLEVTDSTSDVKLLLELDIVESPLLTKVLLPDLEEFKPIKIKLDFDAASQNLQANVDLPMLRYAGIEIDSLSLSLLSSRSQLDFQAFIQKIDAGSASINEANLTAVYEDEKIRFAFNMLDAERAELFNLHAQLWNRRDTVYFHLEDQDFLLNSEPWKVNPNNLVSWSDEHLLFSEFSIAQKQERLQISSPSSAMDQLNVLINFEAFQLANFVSLINPERELADGIIQGELNLLKNEGSFAFAGLITIDELRLMGQEAGKMELSVKNIKENQFDFTLGLKGAADLSMTGYYLATPESPQLVLDLTVNKLSLDLLAPLSEGVIKESEGYISGAMQIDGPLLSPNHNGFIQFNKAKLLVAATNSSFSLPEERINIEADLISLKDFTIVDAQGNKLMLNGKIGTKVLLNPNFDFDLKTQNFQLLNSTKKDNDLYYGKAFVDADIKVKGTLLRPDVRAQVTLKRDSELVFVIPESQIDMISREGTVEFVSFDVDEMVTNQFQRDSVTQKTQVTGLSLQSIVKVDKATKFTVIIDQRSGDYLAVSGQGDLSLDVNRNGMLSLFGIYEIDQGSYQLSMYDLVKRKFEIAPGSSIQWVGDPLNAKMQLTANYQVEASPADLMADQISGADQSVQNRYRNQLPFIVNLNINGELLQPQLSFGLDMPDDRKGALDGSVYAKIQSLNRDENEMNKQVFALLVLNRFFPSSSGAGGATTTQMARSSASQLLTNQLNTLSGRFIKGIDLNMDLASFTDYQNGSAEDRTRLNVNVSKSLFNERFRVSVGSGVDLEGNQRTQQSATDIIGNITLEYLLDEKGVYRVKGFRKNEFVGMLDGQLVVSGIAFLFNKEINRLQELWKEEEEEVKIEKEVPNE